MVCLQQNSRLNVTSSVSKKQKQPAPKENHILFCPFCPRPRLELVFLRTTTFIQFCVYMCELYLHMKINEPDNIVTYPEVLHDATFP